MTTLAIVPEPDADAPEMPVSRADLNRIDRNFKRVEQAIVELRRKPTPTPKRRTRHGYAARFDPDDARATPWLIAGQLTFVAAGLTAAFSGQIAMAPYTTLPPQLYFLVPIFIDLPIILLAYMAQVFRRRKQGAKATWAALILFTAGSSAIQIIHVLSEAGILAGAPISVEYAVGASIMGAVPWIVLFAWEQLTKLLVKPHGEKRDPTPTPAPRRRPAPKKRSPK